MKPIHPLQQPPPPTGLLKKAPLNKKLPYILPKPGQPFPKNQNNKRTHDSISGQNGGGGGGGNPPPPSKIPARAPDAQAVKDRVLNEMKNMLAFQKENDHRNQEIAALYNTLQLVCYNFGLQNIKRPEFVIVGMQSDGKSSFIEGLLKRQFNVVDTNIGTVCPLILQMENDPNCKQPICRFAKLPRHLRHLIDPQSEYADAPFKCQLEGYVEQLEGYEEGANENYEGGDLNGAGREKSIDHEEGEEEFESPVHISDVSEEIYRRSQILVNHKKNTVSSTPIILRIQFYDCATLTIYDTPGFRLDGDEKLKRDIREMVVSIMEPPNRLIICVEQSTTDWSNSVSRANIKEVDPDFSRTTLVMTKFDNRVKELRTADSAAKYLTGECLPPGKMPFFISLPVERPLDDFTFSKKIDECYERDYKTLVECNFDEQKFLKQIGFFRLKKELENLLQCKYIEYLVPTLQELTSTSQKLKQELSEVSKEISRSEPSKKREQINSFIISFVDQFKQLRKGSPIGDPNENGLTLQEEVIACSAPWPHSILSEQSDEQTLLVENANLRIYGSAQYARVLEDFRHYIENIEIEPPSDNEIASALGALRDEAMVAADMVRCKCASLLVPSISVLMKRCSFVVSHLGSILTKKFQEASRESVPHFSQRQQLLLAPLTAHATLVGNSLFMLHVEKALTKLVDEISASCLSKVYDYATCHTISIDANSLIKMIEVAGRYAGVPNYPNETEQANEAGEQKTEDGNEASKLPELPFDAMEHPRETARRLATERNARIYEYISSFFAIIRQGFCHTVISYCHAHFDAPIRNEFGKKLCALVNGMPDEEFQELFASSHKEMMERKETLQHSIASVDEQCRKFKETIHKLNIKQQQQ